MRNTVTIGAIVLTLSTAVFPPAALSMNSADDSGQRRSREGFPAAEEAQRHAGSRRDSVPSSRSSRKADESVELVVRLDENQTYSLREFCRSCNRKLGTDYALDLLPARRIRLSVQEQRLLRLLTRPELTGDDIRVDIQPDRVVLRLPDPESQTARKNQQRRIESLFGIPVSEWPAGKGLHLPGNFDARRRSVLLLHGLEGTLAELRPLARASERAGQQTLFFDYPNDGPVARSGERLHQELTGLARRHPQLKLTIVAHSMGGLVVRHALENCRPSVTCVSDVFMLGTPHRGSALSEGQAWLELVFQSLAPDEDDWSSLRDGLGEAAHDLQPGSRFLRGLDTRRRPPGVRYHTAAGRQGFLTPRELAEFQQRLDARLKERGASLLERARLAGLLRQADALCTGRGDGAVTVSSARLDAADSHRTFDLSHVELIRVHGKTPEASPVFQWIMETLRRQP